MVALSASKVVKQNTVNPRPAEPTGSMTADIPRPSRDQDARQGNDSRNRALLFRADILGQLRYDVLDEPAQYNNREGNRLRSAPLVSVILPVWNGEKFLSQTIRSALSQTYPFLEIVAVDDGSSDRTSKILAHASAADSRLRVFHQPNQGVARARNRAIAEARGEFIAPLDADDLWLPMKIARQVDRLRTAGERAGFVYCWWVWMDEQGLVLDRSPRWAVEGDCFETLLRMNVTGNASAPLFRKRCIEEAGGYDEQAAAADAGGCEDWALALRIAHRHSFAVVPEILLGYRRSVGSMSSARQKMWRSHKRVVAMATQLRPRLAARSVRLAHQQFALYLAGSAYWAGDWIGAIGWALRAGPRLLLLVAPSIVRMLGRRRRRYERTQVSPGQPLQQPLIAEPLLPYDRLLTLDAGACS